MKPILFNTEMVRAVLDGRKMVTRRVVKGVPSYAEKVPSPQPWIGWESESDMWHIKPPYRPGDILYVRETWQNGFGGTYLYKADAGFDLFMTPDGELVYEIPWRPSIHMPREAARTFLRVTDVRVERLQDITEEQAKAEGACNGFPFDDYVDGFQCIWDCNIKPANIALYSWDANPWVWVIEFERISKGEAITNEKKTVSRQEDETMKENDGQ